MKANKTHKKDSMHNKYKPTWAALNLRVNQELRMKIEKLAKERGFGLAMFCRTVLNEAVRDVLLTSKDYEEIALRVKENEERNANRGE